MPTTPRPPRGFTLVELLVVVTLVMLLVAVLLPAVSEARYTARFAVCQSNLRQIAISLTAYSVDNKMVYPAEYPLFPKAWNTRNNLSMLSQYMGGEHDNGDYCSWRNRVWRCPQGILVYPGSTPTEATPTHSGALAYYAVYANQLGGLKNGTVNDVNGNAVPKNPEDTLRGPDDTNIFGAYTGTSGQEYDILASDICRRVHDSSYSSLQTCHVRGGSMVTGLPQTYKPLYYGNIDGNAGINFARTDGSVKRFDVMSNNMLNDMNWANGAGVGAGGYLFPKAWGK